MGKIFSIIAGLSGFLIGVLLASLLGWNSCYVFFLFIPSFIFLRNQKYYAISIWLLIGCAFGVLRFLSSMAFFGTEDIAFYKDLPMKLKVQGEISSEVDIRPDKQYLKIETQRLFYKENWIKVRGKMLIKTARYPEYQYGDLIEINGFLVSPPIFEKFSYADTLAKDDIYIVSYKPEIKILKTAVRKDFWNFIFIFKNLLTSRINQLFSEPEASFVCGLLLGLRKSIPQNILQDFNFAGLTHILAISGYNITLLITIFGTLFKNFSRKIRFFGILAAILFFVAMTGLSASVIRAAWMGFFVLLSMFIGRKTYGILTLLWSAFFMVLLQPRILVWDLSFDLSFGATLGLVLFASNLQNYFSKLPPAIGEALGVTLAAQIFTTPLILYYFGRFSLIAPLANIIFLPLIPFIMLFSFLALFSSFFFMPVGQFFAAIAMILLKILIEGVSFIAKIPFASIEI